MLKKLIQMGYNCNQIRRIFKHYSICRYEPEYLILKIETIFNYLLDLGYTKEQVIRITLKYPSIFGSKIESISQKIEDLITLGYSRQNVFEMIQKHPQILSYNKDKIMEKGNNLISLGYTKEEAYSMIYNSPYILGLSFNNIKKKIDYYKSIGIEQHFVRTTMNLMQSVELSYARYSYLTNECSETINIKNCHILFYSNAFFIEKYRINNETLLMRYKYDICFNSNKEKVKKI